jgi:thioredoxin reductase (NADPH)
MAERPAIVVVDDEPAALEAMLDALTRRFGADYRIVPRLSALAALEAISAIRKDGDEIALVIADQWMPGMTGIDFLDKVRVIDPTAKRALLVAWGDQTASPTVLQGCALGQLDNYLYKPWAPRRRTVRVWNSSASSAIKTRRVRTRYASCWTATAFRMGFTRRALHRRID